MTICGQSYTTCAGPRAFFHAEMTKQKERARAERLKKNISGWSEDLFGALDLSLIHICLTDWSTVTENSVRSTAWSNGLSRRFTYKEMQVGYGTLPSRKQEKVQTLSLIHI